MLDPLGILLLKTKGNVIECDAKKYQFLGEITKISHGNVRIFVSKNDIRKGEIRKLDTIEKVEKFEALKLKTKWTEFKEWTKLKKWTKLKTWSKLKILKKMDRIKKVDKKSFAIGELTRCDQKWSVQGILFPFLDFLKENQRLALSKLT